MWVNMTITVVFFKSFFTYWARALPTRDVDRHTSYTNRHGDSQKGSSSGFHQQISPLGNYTPETQK
jgi:hypothetical protein